MTSRKMLMSTEILIFCILICCTRTLGQIDPCLPSHHTVLTNEHWRSTNYSIVTGWVSKCDSLLPTGWYRFDSGAGNDLATFCPALGACGTVFPIWTPDPLPTLTGNIVTLRTRRNGYKGCNEAPGTIQAKNCTSFIVYELKKISTCPSAYCIGSETRCPSGLTSLTGFTPDCTNVTTGGNVTISAVTLSPDVKLSGQNPAITRQDLVFNCNVNITISSGTGNNYDIEAEFFASGASILSKTANVPANNQAVLVLQHGDWLRATNYAGPYLGQNISCRARTVLKTPPKVYGNWYNSDDFYAGIEVTPSSVVVQQGQTISIILRSTVPISCAIINNQSCTTGLEISMTNPDFHSKKAWSNCGALTQKSLIMDLVSCGVTIPAVNWKKPVSFNVKAVIPKVNVGHNPLSILRFKVTPLIDKMYDNYTLSDVTINILPPAHSFTGMCTFIADPHVLTFDGTHYEHQYQEDYLIMQDPFHDIQIQGYFQSRGHWTTLCAVAVKYIGDVFYYDVCHRNTRAYQSSYPPKRMGLRGCATGEMKITTTSSSFTVFLPNNMRIEGTTSSWGLYLRIYPSALSIGKTDGLCGTFDGNVNNDLRHRDGVTVSPPNPSNGCCHYKVKAFSDSWKINRNESLFYGNFSRILMRSNNFCECDGTWNNVLNYTTCGNGTLAKCYGELGAKDKTKLLFQKCYLTATPTGRRKRRAINIRNRRQAIASSLESDFADEFEDDFDPEIDPTYTVQTPVWKNGWTNALATSHCQKELNTTQALQALSTKGINRQEYISQCVDDIKISGNTTYVEVVKEALVTDARSILLADTTQWATSSAGVLEPPFQSLKVFCRNDCSNQGTCFAGSCDCNVGYLGDDCSKSVNDPPVVKGSARGGICDISQRPCEVFTLYGEDFNENTLGTCRVTEITMDSNGNILSSSAPQVTAREVETEYKAFCYEPQLQGRRKRSASTSGMTVQGYQIQSSNNGFTYSGNTTVLVIDTTCLNCNATTAVCTLKPQTCSINGDCYVDGGFEVRKPCRVCDSSVDAFSFTTDVNTCFINGHCYNVGDSNSFNACQICDPNTWQRNWTSTTCPLSTGPASTNLPTTTPLPTSPSTSPTAASSTSFSTTSTTTSPSSAFSAASSSKASPTTTITTTTHVTSTATASATTSPTTASLPTIPTTSPSTTSTTTSPTTNHTTTSVTSSSTTSTTASLTTTSPSMSLTMSPTRTSSTTSPSTSPATLTSATRQAFPTSPSTPLSTASGATTSTTSTTPVNAITSQSGTQDGKIRGVGELWWTFLVGGIGLMFIIVIAVVVAAKKIGGRSTPYPTESDSASGAPVTDNRPIYQSPRDSNQPSHDVPQAEASAIVEVAPINESRPPSQHTLSRAVSPSFSFGFSTAEDNSSVSPLDPEQAPYIQAPESGVVRRGEDWW